jgi:hypothetical protein
MHIRHYAEAVWLEAITGKSPITTSFLHPPIKE